MGFKEMYAYLFYIFYKIFDSFKTTRWLMDMKAIVCVFSLEFWILFSGFNYCKYFLHLNYRPHFFTIETLIPFTLLIGLNCLFFLKDDRWKEYVEKFDQLPKEQNTKGRYIVISLTIFLFLNLIFSIYINPPVGGWK